MKWFLCKSLFKSDAKPEHFMGVARAILEKFPNFADTPTKAFKKKSLEQLKTSSLRKFLSVGLFNREYASKNSKRI